MNRYDRVVAVARGVQVEIPDPCSFEEQVGIDPVTGKELFRLVKLKREVINKIIGLIEFRINFTTGEIVFDFTGKFLPSEYRNLINKENILSYLEHINYFKFVKLDAKNFLQNSRVRVLHSTIDIAVQKEPAKYLRFLHNLIQKTENVFQSSIYRNGNVEIRRTAETNRQCITCYSKGKEIMRNNKNNACLKKLISLDDWNYFNQVIRFEQKLSNRNQEITRLHNLSQGDNTLVSVLNSTEYPVVNNLNNLFDVLEVPNEGNI